MCLAVFGYRVGERAVEIRFLGIQVRSIPFSDIGEISLGSRGVIGEVWTIFKLWGLVTITKKEDCLKYVTLAPKNPQKFVAEVQAKISEADRTEEPRQLDAGTRTPDSKINVSSIAFLVLIIVSFTLIVIYIYRGTLASEIVVNAESVQVKGLYNVEIMVDDIYDITLEESMPEILRKTNGFSFGAALKGHFELQDIGQARLYVNVDDPPYIYIDTADGLIIVNQEDRQSTEELYRNLMNFRQ